MLKILVAIIISLICISTSYANYGDVEVEKVVRVYDGDTFFVNIANWPEVVSSNIGIRIRGIDTAELRGIACGYQAKMSRAAKEFLEFQLQSAKVIELRNIERGKYFRLIADVYVDDVSVAYKMTKIGVAKPYNGGRKSDWCKKTLP